MKTKYFYSSIFILLASCAPQKVSVVENPDLKSVSAKALQDVSCKSKNFEAHLWDALKSYVIEQKTMIDPEQFKMILGEQLGQLSKQNPQLTSVDVARLSAAFNHLIDSLLKEAPAGERVETPEQLLGLLSAIDVGDQSTLFRAYIQNRVRRDLAELNQVVQDLNLNCQASDEELNAKALPVVVNEDYEYLKKQALNAGIPLAVFGERWAFATAYQTCQSLEKDPLNAKTPDIQGISIIGKHSDGVGNKRIITNLSQVQATHPYIQDVSSYGQGCFEVRNNPLIYDYGGKPYATTAATSPLDFFKNNGDGTSVLGIDCSGFVFSSMAAAGLKLKSGRDLKAADAWAWGSTSYVEPQSNGLTCLAKISVTPDTSLQAGDIVAVPGHVILIDKVGADPFGIGQATTDKDCAAITAAGFDFVVAQSSPSVGAVGINHFSARDYLPTSSKMNAGLQKYAYYACLAKVQKKTFTPNLGSLSVVRHKGTPDCLASRVSLARESCIQSCASSSFTN